MPARTANPVLLIVTALAGVAATDVQAQQGVVYGAVYDSTRAEPLANAAVVLWETPFGAVTDAEGRYRISDLPPGDYSVLFFHTRLGEMGVSVGPRPITVEGTDSLRIDLGTPSMFTLVSSQCLMEDFTPGTGVIAGWVGDGSTGVGMPGAQVTLSWDAEATQHPDQLNLRTGSNGWYLTCEAPAATPISAAARFLDREGRRRELTVAEHSSTEAGFLLFELESTSVGGRLLDASAATPVTGAVVWLRGTSIRGLTDGSGRFNLKDVPPGTYMLMSEHLAYGTKMDTLEVPSGRRLTVEMMLDTRPIEIAPIDVTVNAIPTPVRAMGGIRISPAAVERVRHISRDVTDILRAQHLAGVIVRRESDGSLCVGYAPGQVRMMFRSGCVPMVIFLNGVRSTNTDMVLRLPPDAVDRMVIYKPVEAGSLFGLGSGNGVLMIYTKGN